MRESFATKNHWWFLIQLGDLKYHAWCDMGKAMNGEWQDNAPVKLRFEIKGGAVATRTWIQLLNDQGKETKLEVTGIYDKDDHNYCSNFKCDPESAEKKLHSK